MKKIIGFACIVFLLLTLSVPIFAQETVITADVPVSHTVTVISDNGKIILDGKAVSGKQQIERHKKQSYRIIPQEGKQLDRLLYNGEDVTSQVKNSVYTAPPLVHDAVLAAIYKDVPQTSDAQQSSQTQSNPQPSEGQSSQPSLTPTGDNSNILLFINLLFVSVSALCIFFIFARKKQKVHNDKN